MLFSKGKLFSEFVARISGIYILFIPYFPPAAPGSLTGQISRAPGPLEIIASAGAIHIQQLSRQV